MTLLSRSNTLCRQHSSGARFRVRLSFRTPYWMNYKVLNPYIKKTIGLSLFSLLALLQFLVSSASAVPINTVEGFTPYEGQWIIRSQVRVKRMNNDPSSKERTLTAVIAPTTIVYGLSERLAGIAVLPFVSKNMDLTGPSGRVRRGDEGIGDIKVLVKYRLKTLDEPGMKTTRYSFIGGTTLPTGSIAAADGMGPLPRPLQVGRGDYEPVVGLTVTRWTAFRALSADVIAQWGAESEGYRFGDTLRYDLAYEYALWPKEIPETGLPDYLYAILELNGSITGKDSAGGIEDPNTGGHVLYLSPGLQFISPRFAVEGSLQIPLVTDLNGEQPEPDWATVLSYRLSW